MNDFSVAELKSEIDESNRLLNEANKKLEKLQSQVKFPGIRNQYKFYKNLLVQKYKLLKDLQNNAKDIKDYKQNLNELQKKLESNKNIINALIKENQSLKLQHQSNQNQNQPKKKIRGASDLRQSFGFNLKRKRKRKGKRKGI